MIKLYIKKSNMLKSTEKGVTTTVCPSLKFEIFQLWSTSTCPFCPKLKLPWDKSKKAYIYLHYSIMWTHITRQQVITKEHETAFRCLPVLAPFLRNTCSSITFEVTGISWSCGFCGLHLLVVTNSRTKINLCQACNWALP